MSFHPRGLVTSVILAALVVACSGAAADERQREPALPFRFELQGETVRRVLPTRDGVLAFREPTGGGLTEHWVARSLAWFAEGGASIAELRAAEDELFVDAVTHPSGETTLFVVEREGCSLRRYSAAGTLLGSTRVTEPDLTTDPTDTTEEPVIPWNVGGCQPTEIRESGLDASGRIAQRWELPQRARHDAALSVVQGRASRDLFVGGLINGPGSHSADANPALLRADGWLERITAR